MEIAVHNRVETAVVIPVHNGRDGLARCLEYLEWCRDRADTGVVVVDSGSTDGSAELVSSRFAWVHLVSGPDTMWWTEATNLGARYALESLGVRRLCLLNHDCLLSEVAYTHLSACQAEHPLDIVCAQVRVAGGDEALFQGGRVLWSGKLAIDGFLARPDPEPPSRYVVWCGGMGVLVPRLVYEMLGGFDGERFPHYWADADFCLRASRLGVRVWYCSDAVVLNDRSTTGLSVNAESASLTDIWRLVTHRKSAVNVRDTFAFYRRHFGLRAPVPLLHVYVVHLGSALRRVTLRHRRPGTSDVSASPQDGRR